MRLESDRAHHEHEYRALGIAVLRQAVEDAENVRLPEATREGARAWLRGGSARFRLWCHVAGLDPDTVAAQCRRLYPRRREETTRRAS